MHSAVKVLMFTDQVDSTRQTEQRTGAEIQQVTRVHQELTAEVLRQRRGTLLKDTGDGVLATFPSCADAMHCGMLLQQRVAAWNEAQSNDRFPSLP